VTVSFEQDNEPAASIKGGEFLQRESSFMLISRDNINTIKEMTETLFGASRDGGLEINEEKTKYMIMSSKFRTTRT
jgi:hypothetical protein